MTQIQWQPGPAHPRLADGTVDVWQADLATAPAGPRELLSEAERERSARFLRPEDGERWASGRGVLRVLLAAYADADPRLLRFAESEYGKPALVAPAPADLRFNLSHSGEIALIAVARGREVGVDVELPRRAVDHVAIARRILAAEEADRIAAIGDPRERERAFLRAWTRWEAVLKCRGTGIGGAQAPADGPDPWVTELPIAPPAVAALAVAGGPCAVRTFRWPRAGS